MAAAVRLHNPCRAARWWRTQKRTDERKRKKRSVVTAAAAGTGIIPRNHRRMLMPMPQPMQRGQHHKPRHHPLVPLGQAPLQAIASMPMQPWWQQERAIGEERLHSAAAVRLSARGEVHERYDSHARDGSARMRREGRGEVPSTAPRNSSLSRVGSVSSACLPTLFSHCCLYSLLCRYFYSILTASTAPRFRCCHGAGSR